MLNLPQQFFFFNHDYEYISSFSTLHITRIWNTGRSQILMSMGTEVELGIVCI